MPFVYVITNPAMPGLVKIGRTDSDDVGLRIAQLNTTAVPLPFELHFACRVPNATQVEDALHLAFGPQRLNPKREFFSIEPDQAIAILKLLHVEETTAEATRELVAATPAEEQRAVAVFKARRPNLNFIEMGIPLGSLLQFEQGDVFVEVVEDRKVRLGEQVLSLTAATRQILGLTYAVQPSPYWFYDGVCLRDIYERTYGGGQ